MTIKMSDVFPEGTKPAYGLSLTRDQILYMDNATFAYDKNQESIEVLGVGLANGIDRITNNQERIKELEAKHYESCVGWRDSFEAMHRRAMKAENEGLELKAMVNDLTKYGNLMKCNLGYSDDSFASGYISLWKKALDTSPAQCLANVKADAVKDAMLKFTDSAECKGVKDSDLVEDFFDLIEINLRKSMIVTKPSISKDELSAKLDEELKDDAT